MERSGVPSSRSKVGTICFRGFLEPQVQSAAFAIVLSPFIGASHCQDNIENAQIPDDDYLTMEVSSILCYGGFL